MTRVSAEQCVGTTAMALVTNFFNFFVLVFGVKKRFDFNEKTV